MNAITLKLFFTSFLFILLSACGGDKPESTDNTQAPTESPAATQGTVYKVAIDVPYPPYVRSNGKGAYEGFDVDILTEIGQREGFMVDWQPRMWDGIYELLQTGEVDIVASGGFETEERRAKYAFTQAYNTETTVLITKDPNATSFDDARGKKIAYLVGGAEEDIVRNLTGSQTLDASLGNKNSWESIKRLVQGQVDFVIDTSSVYGHYAKQYPEQQMRAIAQNNAEASNVAYAVKQDNTELLNKLNQGLSAIKADGTYDKMKAKWFGATP